MSSELLLIIVIIQLGGFKRRLRIYYCVQCNVAIVLHGLRLKSRFTYVLDLTLTRFFFYKFKRIATKLHLKFCNLFLIRITFLYGFPFQPKCL